jgi:DNA polymerase III alpha subunit
VGPGSRVGRWVGGRLLHRHHPRRSDQAQADLRTVPEPGPRLHAGHRHRLRRPASRRDDPLRRERYGDDHVAQIVTFGTIKAKSAIRDAARVLDESFKVGDDLAKMMPPPVQGKEAPLSEAYGKSHELREAREDPTYKRVLETAEKLEGLKRQHGIHAAAVLIGAKPLTETLPLLKTDTARSSPSTR